MKKTLWLIGAIACVYSGLGILGILSGWSNTDTIFSKFFGAGFIFSGLSMFYNEILKPLITIREKNLEHIVKTEEKH